MPRSVFVEDAAVILGVSRRTVYYRIRAGLLQTLRTRNGSQRVLLESIHLLANSTARAPSRRPITSVKGGPITSVLWWIAASSWWLLDGMDALMSACFFVVT